MRGLVLLAALATAAAGAEPPLPPGARVRFGSPAPKGSTGGISALAFSPDGRVIAAGGRDGSVRLYSSADGRELGRLSGHRMEVWALAFSPGGRVLASGSDDCRLLVHDAGTGRLLRTIRPGRVGVTELAFMPDGARLVSNGERYNLEVWDVASGFNVQSLTEHSERVVGLAISPDGRLVATSSGYDTLDVWDAATGRRLFVKKAPASWQASLVDLAFSADGRTLSARDAHDGALYLVGVPTGERFERIETGGGVEKLLPLPGGPEFAMLYSRSKREKWSLDLLDPANGKRVTIFREQEEASPTFSISPDGKSAAVAAPGGTGLIWSMDGRAAPAATPQASAAMSTAAMAALMESWNDPARSDAFFDELRRRYAQSESYDPYGEFYREQLNALRSAVDDEDYKEALPLAEAVLAANPVLVEAHEHAATACDQLGEKERASFHRRLARGLIDSVLRIGDGKTPATAFRTVHMAELEDAMAVAAPGRNVLSRGSMESGGHHYDAWQLGPARGEKGETETVYFDITPIWDWSLRRFGGSP